MRPLPTMPSKCLRRNGRLQGGNRQICRRHQSGAGQYQGPRCFEGQFSNHRQKLQQLPSNLPHQDELTRRATTEGRAAASAARFLFAALTRKRDQFEGGSVAPAFAILTAIRSPGRVRSRATTWAFNKNGQPKSRVCVAPV